MVDRKPRTYLLPPYLLPRYLVSFKGPGSTTSAGLLTSLSTSLSRPSISTRPPGSAGGSADVSEDKADLSADRDSPGVGAATFVLSQNRNVSTSELLDKQYVKVDALLDPRAFVGHDAQAVGTIKSTHQL